MKRIFQRFKVVMGREAVPSTNTIAERLENHHRQFDKRTVEANIQMHHSNLLR